MRSALEQRCCSKDGDVKPGKLDLNDLHFLHCHLRLEIDD